MPGIHVMCVSPPAGKFLRLDPGASVSCMSDRALQRDRQHLLQHGKLRQLTPVTLAGLASGHTELAMILSSLCIIIGKAACKHSMLVVPGLYCDDILGQDFMFGYDT